MDKNAARLLNTCSVVHPADKETSRGNCGSISLQVQTEQIKLTVSLFRELLTGQFPNRIKDKTRWNYPQLFLHAHLSANQTSPEESRRDLLQLARVPHSSTSLAWDGDHLTVGFMVRKLEVKPACNAWAEDMRFCPARAESGNSVE